MDAVRGETMELEIPSDFRFLGAVDAAVQDVAREYAYPREAIDDLSTALIEACSNAIEHGNRFSPDKRVRVSLSFGEERLVAVVHDEGPGFDFESLPGPDSPPDVTCERGRGLLIMQAFSDILRFEYTPGRGLSVELVKNRPSESDDAPSD